VTDRTHKKRDIYGQTERQRKTERQKETKIQKYRGRKTERQTETKTDVQRETETEIGKDIKFVYLAFIESQSRPWDAPPHRRKNCRGLDFLRIALCVLGFYEQERMYLGSLTPPHIHIIIISPYIRQWTMCVIRPEILLVSY